MNDFIITNNNWKSGDVTSNTGIYYPSMLQFRKGGQGPIDRIIEFKTDEIGSLLTIQVFVPNSAILIMESISSVNLENYNGDTWIQQFVFMIDDKTVLCLRNGKTLHGYDYTDKGFCYIAADKGKHVLTIKYNKKVDVTVAIPAIDMIVGI